MSDDKNKDTDYKGFGADSVPQEILDQFAPRSNNPELMLKIQKMLDVRNPSMGLLAPDGKTLFFHWDATGSMQVWKVDGPLRFPVQMTGGEDASTMNEITPDGRWLIISRDSGGDEHPGLYLQSVDGGELIEVHRKKKVQTFFSHVTEDSRYIYFRANVDNPSVYAFYKYEITTKEIELIYQPEEGFWYIEDHWKDEALLLGNVISSRVVSFYLFDLAKKQLQPIFKDDQNEHSGMSFGKSKEHFVVKTDIFGEFYRLCEFHKGEFKFLTPEYEYGIDELSVDKVGKKIIFSTNNKGYSEVAAIDLVSGELIQTTDLKDKETLNVFSGRTTYDGRYTSFLIERYDSPRAAYVYDWEKKEKTQWLLPSSPEVDTSGFVKPELESYTARDGTEIPIFVWRPKDHAEKNYPVILDFHGGPEGQARPMFSVTIPLFNNEGYIWARPNVRGSSGYGKAWLNADNGPKRLDVISDIEDAALHVKKNWKKFSETPKVVAFGGSYGGYSVYAGMTMFAGAFDAGVSIVGMSDLVSFLQNTAPYRRKLRATKYGSLENDLEALKKLSPINYLDKAKDPLLIIHGATDPRVPAGEAIQIYNALKEKNVMCDMILFPDEGHGIRKRKNVAVYLVRILDFLKKNL